MRLKNFETDSGWNELRRLMGADKLGDLHLKEATNILTEDEIRALSGAGIDVQWDQVRVLEDGTLAFKNRRVVLYIRDVSIYGSKSIQDVVPKFHVARCRTLDDMHSRGRGQRYVVATRTTGEFAINVIRNGAFSDKQDLRLAVCQNCLDRLHFDGFSYGLDKGSRESHVSRFSLERFFEQYPVKILDENDYDREDTAPLNEYPPEFRELAREIKAKADYRCGRCGWKPQREVDRRFVHLHHVNGQKYDNRSGNFAVRCIGCHALEEFHDHMKDHPDYSAFMALRARG